MQGITTTPDGPPRHGIVYLVGAGPGDPGLVTLRAKRLLETADVIVYDRLAPANVLCFARPGAEIIFAGKEASSHALSQDAINSLLAEQAAQGKSVVRLKGGDPFLFGRGGEEALFLAGRGIPFEIVPGVTSAIAAPAYAGIPVTHRDTASGVAILTGHEKPGKQRTSLRWRELAQGIDTLVFLMAVENLGAIVENLLRHGKPPATACALVRCGTTADQRVIVGTLGSIAQAASDAALTPPAVFVVGDVAALREKLAWVEQKPLWGKRIVVTRPLPQAGGFAERLADLGAEPVLFPTVEIIKTDDLRPLHAALADIASYDWIVFTSVNAVAVFCAEMAARRIDIRDLRGIRLAAIGPETRAAIETTGCLVDVMPEKFSADGLLAALREKVRKGEKMLLPRARNARSVLPDGLRREGVRVDEICLYEAAVPRSIDPATRDRIQAGAFDILTFASPSAVHNFVRMIGDDMRGALARTKTAVIGPVTASAARACGLTVAVEARDFTTAGLLAALIEHTEI